MGQAGREAEAVPVLHIHPMEPRAQGAEAMRTPDHWDLPHYDETPDPIYCAGCADVMVDAVFDLCVACQIIEQGKDPDDECYGKCHGCGGLFWREHDGVIRCEGCRVTR